MSDTDITAARRRARRLGVVVALTAATVLVPAADVAHASPTAHVPDGTTSDRAAASCWEIKQTKPSSVDGTYWLRTETMVRPARFHCDMTTDGGGWVLIGRGREGWTFREYGQGTGEDVHSSVDGPAAFAPAALSTKTIDALLDGGDVKDLPDGVRVRRATNLSGTGHQELRWNFLDLESWSWAFGGGHRLSAWSIDGASGTGSNTRSSRVEMPGEVGAGNRSGNRLDSWFTYPWGARQGAAGFSYTGNVDGANNATSYLWEFASENAAIPFTQIYLRPVLTSAPLPTIGDAGLPASTLPPLLSDRAASLDGGVTGVWKIGDSEPNLDTPVQALATAGDRVFVGGKFKNVETGKGAAQHSQSYLAAFDRDTGVWDSTFLPQLDGTVWDLVVVGNRLIVAGQFTNVDGVAKTAGLAAIDLTTGLVDPTWQASLAVSGTSDRPFARALHVDGNWIYVGGNFTSIESFGVVRSEARLGRVAVANGRADTRFRPDIGGTVYDLEVAHGRAYVAGNFHGVNASDDETGDSDIRGFAVVDQVTGELVAGLAEPIWTDDRDVKKYQQAVVAVGDTVWQGGSQHNVHAYDKDGYVLRNGFVTSDRGGDTQALDAIGDIVYQGSHANAWIYEDATTWPGLDDYTRVDDYHWMGAFDNVTGDLIKEWLPSVDTAYDEGGWALHADDEGCLWFGGDFNGGAFVGGTREYLQGFSKFCQRDTTAPTVPGDPGATDGLGGVIVDWSPSTDDEPGFIGYEVLRNDRVVSPLVYGTAFLDRNGSADDRYFVRAVDATGNRSATTPVFVVIDDVGPTTPPNLVGVPGLGLVTLSWNASTDNVGVTEYRVYRNGATVTVVGRDVFTVVVDDLADGSHWFQVQAADAAGNTSPKTAPIEVVVNGPDTYAPTTPTGLAATVDPTTGVITARWTASTDNIGVDRYELRRNGALVDTVLAPMTTSVVDLGEGNHHLQVQAFDATGNSSHRTAPQLVVVDLGGDEQRPTTPGNLSGTVGSGDVIALSWTPSTDNVGVDGYRVLRNGVEWSVVPGDATTTDITGLSAGDHFIQIQAFDAAGNQSFRTPPVLVTITSPDTTPPTAPNGVGAVARPDGSVIVSWAASTDDVGVASYSVLRNLVAVAGVATTTASITGLGSGNHYIQVQAVDGAGNVGLRSSPVLVTLP